MRIGDSDDLYMRYSIPMELFETSKAIEALKGFWQDDVEYDLDDYEESVFKVHIFMFMEYVYVYVEVWFYLITEGPIDPDILERNAPIIRWLIERGYSTDNSYDGVVECVKAIAWKKKYSSKRIVANIDKKLKQEHEIVMSKIKEMYKVKETLDKKTNAKNKNG
ncbi:MAG: hypothetical protein QW520_02520 [Methanomassiliicoccales archaeon]